jgi:hypothetical protein
MDDEEKELLAQFHHTISEQLNSRLSESPQFFGLLVVVATGYGYVLSDNKYRGLVHPATFLVLACTLWAAWYLAALGYGFRYLQTTQHRIEHELKWTPYTFEKRPLPNKKIRCIGSGYCRQSITHMCSV